MLTCPAVQHGRTYEAAAIKAYEKQEHAVVKKCGLFVNPLYCFLGASPDGLIGDEGLIEVKCPFAARNNPISIEDIDRFSFLEAKPDRRIGLKRSHNYYQQIQGQLGITKRKYCHFIVFTFKDLYVERIEYDEDHFEREMIPKLKSFYDKTYLPYLCSKL